MRKFRQACVERSIIRFFCILARVKFLRTFKKSNGIFFSFVNLVYQLVLSSGI